MSEVAFTADAFYAQLGIPESCLLDKRIYKRMVLEHGQLTAADKKTLSEDVGKLTWKFTLKPSTIQLLPYEDTEREYLEIAVIEAVLNERRRVARIAEVIQRAIPYPVLLIMVEGSGICASVARKRFSQAEKGAIVAEEFLLSPWIESQLSEIDQQFVEALKLRNLLQTDFYTLYSGMANSVLARICAELTGKFELNAAMSARDRRQHLEQYHQIDREIGSLRKAISDEDRFAEKVELNTRIKDLETQLAVTKATL